MPRARRFFLISVTAVMICFLGHTALTMAEENVTDVEQTFSFSEEMTLQNERLSFRVSSSEVLAQAEPGLAGATAAGSDAGHGATEAEEQAKMAEAMNNPLSYLWLAFIQNDTTWYDGDLLDQLNEDAKVQNTTLIQPVMSFQLTETWKSIVRPVIPINSFETLDNVDISTGTTPQITGETVEKVLTAAFGYFRM